MNKAIELHKKWCSELQPPRCPISKVDMTTSFMSTKVPDEPDDQLKLYKNLANDFPFVMDFEIGRAHV